MIRRLRLAWKRWYLAWLVDHAPELRRRLNLAAIERVQRMAETHGRGYLLNRPKEHLYHLEHQLSVIRKEIRRRETA